jgi:hypothetical protein
MKRTNRTAGTIKNTKSSSGGTDEGSAGIERNLARISTFRHCKQYSHANLFAILTKIATQSLGAEVWDYFQRQDPATKPRHGRLMVALGAINDRYGRGMPKWGSTVI